MRLVRFLRFLVVTGVALLAIVAVVLGVLITIAGRRPPGTVHDYFRTPAQNISHRGGGIAAPEATLLALDRAVEDGADILEMDIRLSSDQRMMVIHDDTVDRTTDGTGAVATKSFEELRRLNAGQHFEPSAGVFPYRENPLLVPTYGEVLEAHPDLRHMVEMKTGDSAALLCDAIRAAGRKEETLVAAFAQESLDEFRTLCPGVATGASFREVVIFLALSHLRLSGFFDRPPDALLVSELSGPLRVVTERLLRDARRRGLPVFVWTVNDPADMERLLDLGVDGILTDDTAALSTVLSSRR